MERPVLLAAVVVLAGIPLQAQEYPRAEAFGGFSIYSVANGGRETFLGWQTSVSANVHRNVGLVGDFGGQYKEVFGIRLQAYQFLFGPEFKLRTERATVFVHVLIGAAHVRGGGIGENGLAFGGGVGLDLNMGSVIAIRMPQLDYVPTRFGEDNWSRKDVRLGVGLVFKLGGAH